MADAIPVHAEVKEPTAETKKPSKGVSKEMSGALAAQVEGAVAVSEVKLTSHDAVRRDN
jgi:hypothetical protein